MRQRLRMEVQDGQARPGGEGWRSELRALATEAGCEHSTSCRNGIGRIERKRRHVECFSDRGRHQYPGTKTCTPTIPAGYLTRTPVYDRKCKGRLLRPNVKVPLCESFFILTFIRPPKAKGCPTAVPMAKNKQY